MTDLSQDPFMKQNDLNKVNYLVNSDPILHHYIVGFYTINKCKKKTKILFLTKILKSGKKNLEFILNLI